MQAQTRPEAVALVCGAAQMSYGELERRSNRLARLLRKYGIGCGDCVGLLLPRSMDVYVPLDPDYPAERVGFILSDCQARAVITTSALASKAKGSAGKLIELDRLQAELSSQPSDKLGRQETGLRPEDLCYVIYTSGTTGKPKGVQIEHRSVCHLVRAEGDIFRVHPADRVFQGFSIAFDASVEEIWLAFFAGATLVVGTESMVHAGAGLSRLLAEARVTVLSCVPTLLSMMEDDVPSLRLLILGGEACPADLVKRWVEAGLILQSAV